MLRYDRYHRFGERIQGIILFGTPHNGARTDDLLEMVDKGNTDSEYFLLQLKEGSQFLEKEKEALVNLWSRYQGKVVTFFETRDTKQLTKVRWYSTFEKFH